MKMIADYVLAELEMSLTKDVLKQLQWRHPAAMDEKSINLQANYKTPKLRYYY